MSMMASQITSLTVVCWIVYTSADQRKHQSSASLAFVRGIHRGPVNSPHKWPVTRKMFPFDDVIMVWRLVVNIKQNQMVLGYSGVPLQRGIILHKIAHIAAVPNVEYKWELEATNDTPYLALTGELWGGFCDDFRENWPRYNGTALYHISICTVWHILLATFNCHVTYLLPFRRLKERSVSWMK